MISAAVVSSLRVLRIRERSRSCGVRAVGRDQRHHAHPGLETGQPQHQQREGQHRRADQSANPPPPAVSAAVQSDTVPGW